MVIENIKQPIIRDGLTFGYRLYKPGGIFNESTFIGYQWLIEEVSIHDIKHAHYGHWFDACNMRFFNSRLPQTGYKAKGTIYFVSSEQYDYKSARLYSVRVIDIATGSIDTVGEFQQYKTRSQANTAIKNILKSANT